MSPSRNASTIYLDADYVLGLYAQLFGLTPEQAADQLRSRAALEGAVARPSQHAHYAEADLPFQAAVLARGIAESQPFVDGNKRLALVSLSAFLAVNGKSLGTTQARLAHWILQLSEGLTDDELASRIHAVLVPRARP